MGYLDLRDYIDRIRQMGEIKEYNGLTDLFLCDLAEGNTKSYGDPSMTRWARLLKVWALRKNKRRRG